MPPARRENTQNTLQAGTVKEQIEDTFFRGGDLLHFDQQTKKEQSVIMGQNTWVTS